MSSCATDGTCSRPSDATWRDAARAQVDRNRSFAGPAMDGRSPPDHSYAQRGRDDSTMITPLWQCRVDPRAEGIRVRHSPSTSRTADLDAVLAPSCSALGGGLCQ